MAVTYAWKIDSQLYSYIVNPNCLTEEGNLDSQYITSPETYMGYVTTIKVEEEEISKIKEYCKDKFATKGEIEYRNYQTYFEYMVNKIHSFSTDNGDSYPYRYVDLLSAEKYFNVDTDCDEGEKIILDLINRELNKIVSGASESFDTLKEISEWIIAHSGQTLSILDNIDSIETRIQEIEESVSTNTDAITEINETFVERIDVELNKIISGAPESFDTLKEISDWIESHSGKTISIIKDIKTLQTKVSGNTIAIKSNAEEIENLQEKVSGNTTAIAALQDKVSEDTSGLREDIDSNSGAIATLSEAYNNLLGFAASPGQLVIIRPTDNWSISFDWSPNDDEDTEEPIDPYLPGGEVIEKPGF